jgi:hypothetical protein
MRRLLLPRFALLCRRQVRGEEGVLRRQRMLRGLIAR